MPSFVVTTFFLLGSGLLGQPSNPASLPIQLSSHVQVTAKDRDGRIESVYCHGHLAEDDLANVLKLADLKAAWFYRTMLSSDDVSKIGKLTKLEALELTESLPDDSMSGLAGLVGLKTLSLSGNEQFSGRGLVYFKGFTKLECLDLRDTTLRDEFMDSLGAIKSLRTLVLRNCVTVNGTGLKHLIGIPGLTSLNLEFTGVDDSAMGYVGQLAALRQLWLEGSTRVSDAGFAKLGDLTKLEEIGLPSGLSPDRMTTVARFVNLRTLRGHGAAFANGFGSIQGVARLRDLEIDDFKFRSAFSFRPFQQIRSLRLRNALGADDIVKDIACLAQLRELDLEGADLSDRGAAQLVALPALIALDLSGTRVTNQAIPFLKQLKNLRKLDLRDSMMDGSAPYSEIRKAIPGCQVEWPAELQTK